MSCSICAHPISDNQILLPCFHGFCFTCFDGPKCPLCDKAHDDHVIPVVKLFPIPSLFEALKFLGLKYVTLGAASNFVVIDAEKCCECFMYGKLFVCIDLDTGEKNIRNLCSQCSNIIFDPNSHEIHGEEEVFFRKIERLHNRVVLPPNYELIQLFNGKSVEFAIRASKKMLENLPTNTIVDEESCERLLQIFKDCQPNNGSFYSKWKSPINDAQYYAALNQMFRVIAPYCLRWHKIPSLQYALKYFLGRAFGYSFDKDNRKLNLTLVTWFLYFMRNKTMYQFDWINHAQFPDDSYYVCNAIQQK